MQLPEQQSWLPAHTAPFIWQVDPASSDGQPRSTHWLLRQALTHGLLPSLHTVAQAAAGLTGQSETVVHERAVSLPDPPSSGGPDPASPDGQPRSTHWLLRQALTHGLLPSLHTVAQLAPGLIGQSATVVHESAVSRASAPATGRASSEPMGSWEDELHWNPKRGIVRAIPATHRTMIEI